MNWRRSLGDDRHGDTSPSRRRGKEVEATHEYEDARLHPATTVTNRAGGEVSGGQDGEKSEHSAKNIEKRLNEVDSGSEAWNDTKD